MPVLVANSLILANFINESRALIALLLLFIDKDEI